MHSNTLFPQYKGFKKKTHTKWLPKNRKTNKPAIKEYKRSVGQFQQDIGKEPELWKGILSECGR